MRIPHYVLDASALYRFVTDGPGADKVEELFKKARLAKATISMSVINYGEVFYSLTKVHGYDKTKEMLEKVRALPFTIWDADLFLTESAAMFRSRTGLHYADCFAVAISSCAEHRGGVIVTTDKHFKKVPNLQVLTLPA